MATRIINVKHFNNISSICSPPKSLFPSDDRPHNGYSGYETKEVTFCNSVICNRSILSLITESYVCRQSHAGSNLNDGGRYKNLWEETI
jgi:hypothetical protein